jgi:hypothetical protein
MQQVRQDAQAFFAAQAIRIAAAQRAKILERACALLIGLACSCWSDAIDCPPTIAMRQLRPAASACNRLEGEGGERGGGGDSQSRNDFMIA